MNLGDLLAPYRKTIAVLVGEALLWWEIVQESASSSITADEWRLLGIALATALGVYGVTNRDNETVEFVIEDDEPDDVVQPETSQLPPSDDLLPEEEYWESPERSHYVEGAAKRVGFHA